MTSYIEKFHEFGLKRDKNALEKLMEDLEEMELINLVKNILGSSNFLETWKYILESFSDSCESHTKRLTLAIWLLKEFEERDFSQSSIDSIITRLNLELPKFKSSDLSKICSLCLEQIQSKKTIKFIWKDLLPEVLKVLVERETFVHEELDFTGAEYKSDFINTICMSSWSPSIVTSLTAFFIDIRLTKEEHLKVVTKLGSYLEKLTPQEIPAFVYQLLRLCKLQNGRTVFLKLQNYFAVRIYNNKAKNGSEDTDSNSLFDLIETTDNTETIEAESTVLYHIHTAASLGYQCVKEYLNSLKHVIKAPELILQPFQLMVLFTISTISHYEETVFEIIRPAIVRSYNEEQKKRHSCWFREMVPLGQKPEEVLALVIRYGLPDRDMVLTGLVNFAFVLLRTGAGLGRDIIAEKQWSLGNSILLKIIKRKRIIALTVLKTLGDHIVSNQSVSQYIECFYILSRTMPLLMIENQSCTIELINRLAHVSTPIANQLLDAIIPLIKVSVTIRDHLIIFLRKSLYSRSIDTRKMAVTGFLKLIRNLKISNMAVLSQDSMNSFSSGYSVFTQLSMNNATQNGVGNFSNEALCFEILGILKRCFMQQAEVRIQLYEGLYDAVGVNPELAVPILDVIWFNLKEYVVFDEETLPPIHFDKLVALKEAQMVLEEPFGKLLHTVGLIVTKVMEKEDERENNTVMKFAKVLESLSQRMSNCELVHLDLDDGTDLLDVIPESQKKMLVLKECMCIYEGLFGYKIDSWDKESEKQGQSINSLLQGHNRLLHFAKSLSKPKKKKDNDKTTQQTQKKAAAKRKKDETQSSQPKREPQKISAKNLKFPDTVWNFETVKKALSLLHEPKVTWTTATEANVVKAKRELHQHVMQVTLHLVQGVKRRKDLDTQTKKLYFDHITDVATLLYKRIITRLEEFIDFDSVTAILAMECFNSILVIVNAQYKSNLGQFLNKVVADEKIDTLTELETKIVETYQKIFENEEYELSDNLETKKISLLAVTTLRTVINQLPTTSSALSIQILEWVKNYATNNTLNLKNSMEFINLFFETHIKFKVSLTLFENISVSIGEVVGVISENEGNKESFKCVTEGSVHNILLSLCSSIKLVLEDIDSVVVRLKAEYFVINNPGEEHLEQKRENLKMKERGVCCQLCFVVTILTNLSNLLVPPGNFSEAIFKTIILCFTTLSSLTKHFNTRSTKTNLAFQGARFERLVKLTGKQLAPAIYAFILHLDENQSKSTQATQAKKKTVDASTLKSKVLRETRLIPKVVYEIEQFSKCVIQLSNKTKVDLSKYVGQGTVRDFRIIGLKDTLKEQGTGGDGDESYEDAETSRTEETEMENEGEENSKEGEEDEGSEDSDDNDENPPSKRSKR